MPNKHSRTQHKNKGKGTRGSLLSAAGPVWPAGRKTTELKIYGFQGGNYQLYHNVPVAMTNTANLFDNITNGTAATNRIGARIHVERLRARIAFNNKSDRPNVSYRVAVTATLTSTSTDTFSELFYSGGFTGVHIPMNSQLLYDATFPLNQGSGMDNNVTPNKERTFNHVLDIPISKSVVYNVGDNKAMTSLTVWFVAYDAYGTLITDNIASVPQVTWVIDYTDA